MIAAGSLEFALPRLHSRLARRPSQGMWAAIEQARSIASIVDDVRETTLATLAGSLATNPDLHAVDRAARFAWSQAVSEAVAWMPPEWSRAIAWCALLPKLPALAYLAQGHKPAAWMCEDRDLAQACTAPPGNRLAALSLTALAPLMSGLADPARLPVLWHDEWHSRWPGDASESSPLGELARHFARHFGKFRQAQPHEAQQLRRHLEARLLAAFRRHPLEPVAAFAWLGLTALDLERMRGELVRRIAFPDARIAA